MMLLVKGLKYFLALALCCGSGAQVLDNGMSKFYKTGERSPIRTAIQQHVILPLGDSITSNGFGYLSYRYFLWKSLVLRGDVVVVDFVGTLRDNYNQNPEWPPVNGIEFDRDHEGHWGWRADAILGAMDQWLVSYSVVPTVALIHLGTNDCFQGQSVDSTLMEMEEIVGNLLSYNANMHIFVATLIPSSSAQDCIDAFNSGLVDLVASLATKGPVHLVNMANGFSVEDDTWDGTHPNEQGSNKMAEKWLESMDANIVLGTAPVPTSSVIGKGDMTCIHVILFLIVVVWTL